MGCMLPPEEKVRKGQLGEKTVKLPSVELYGWSRYRPGFVRTW